MYRRHSAGDRKSRTTTQNPPASVSWESIINWLFNQYTAETVLDFQWRIKYYLGEQPTTSRIMPRKPNTDLRRAEIVAALLSVIAARGYDQSTVQAIAQEAG